MQLDEAPNTKHWQGWTFIYQGLSQVTNNRVTQSSMLKGFKNSKCNLLKSWGAGRWYRDTAQTKTNCPKCRRVSKFRAHTSKWHLHWLEYSQELTVEELSLDNYASYSFCLLLLPCLHPPISIDRCKTTSGINDHFLHVKIHPLLLSQNWFLRWTLLWLEAVSYSFSK